MTPAVRLGTDVVDIERFRRVLARRPNLSARLFTAGEQAAVAGRNQPAGGLAARFAAKEATMKALGVGLGAFGFHDVEVVTATSGAPGLRLTGEAAALARQRGVSDWAVSLSHSDLVALAVVVGW